mmetsp:Transcript_8847/g.20036  ORF Transcript_8847/g.20036 Transcript_8847/m.20036 type:complete len:277 (-) Transcript_8847:74-904(-)
MPSPLLTYYSAWFCPYAHRATIALSHHAASVSYKWVEALGWEKRPSEDANTRAQTGEPEHDSYYHWKHPDLLRITDGEGLIPTFQDEKGRVVKESLMAVEYVDDLASAVGDPATRNTPLLPADPAERARCRWAAEWANKKMCSPYYTMLVRTDVDERRRAFDELLESLAWWGSQRQGTFYCGDTLSAADVAPLPWAARYYILEHYRNFVIPRDDAQLAGFHEWRDAALALPTVASTLPDRDRYLDHIAKYADASARSKVANAVRSGRGAHDLQEDD